ncbi:hypothetical protein [Herbaspirillum sp. alder98]|uniref:hypothetical protein n=1 Tax=Herbaspirillum sp. alder98 TaxID=2913096 RepID=UPI001CD8A0C4|nr:hypothetical protein [Herbaspirillum sp. alder98]MCA1326067.1 hypothetical protein [Herbaspirillum sp. alder98]
MKGLTEGELLLRCVEAAQDWRKKHAPRQSPSVGGRLKSMLTMLGRWWKSRKLD